MKKFEGYEDMIREMNDALPNADYMLDVDIGEDASTFFSLRLRRTSNDYYSKVPEIYLQDGSFGRRTFSALVQTTSYGAVNTTVMNEVIAKLIAARQIAIKFEDIAMRYDVEIAPHTENCN